MLRISSRQYHNFIDLRKIWYPKGKKVIPKDLSWIDDFSVAKWYMDDGSLCHNKIQKDRAVFSTNCFTKKDVNRLAKKLHDLYFVSCTVFFSKGWSIRIKYDQGSINTFWERISPYIVPCMKYKLPEEYRNVKFIDYEKGFEVIKKYMLPIKKITDVLFSKSNFPFGSVGFDIETSTNNYVCGGVLVHNSSSTFFKYDNQFRVCGHKLEFKENDKTIFWNIARRYNLKERFPDGYAAQGETAGESICKNRIKLKGVDFYGFYVIDIKTGQYLKLDDMLHFLKEIGLKSVPVITDNFILDHTVDELLAMADAPSPLNPNEIQEGTVYRLYDSTEKESFKVISNA
jgi:hypothetical protein